MGGVSREGGSFLSTPSPCFRRANAEIAQVRGKAQQEQAAYQASLRKEQLRVDALERTLEQKVTAKGWGVEGQGPEGGGGLARASDKQRLGFPVCSAAPGTALDPGSLCLSSL